MPGPITFTPSTSELVSGVIGVSVTVAPSATGKPQVFNMPGVDNASLDTRVTVSPVGCTAYIGFAANAAVGPDMPGCLVVQGGTPALLLFNPALAGDRLLASCVAGPADPYGAIAARAQGQAASSLSAAAQAAAASGGVAQFTARMVPAGGTITIERGTATLSSTF